jgi:RNA 2',3'-cyclic 3'-phosphodiesterase
MQNTSQPAFDFIGPEPRRPQRPERLFLALFPDAAVRSAASAINREITDELDLIGSALDIERYHTTIVHLSDRKRLRSKDQYAAGLAATAVNLPPFEIIYTRLGSFPGAPRKGRPPEHPLVLLAEHGPVLDLQATLSRELRKYGFRPPENFRPHLTLSYNRQFVPIRAIDPIAFVVTEFVLVHSRLWLKEYHILKRWLLRRSGAV